MRRTPQYLVRGCAVAAGLGLVLLTTTAQAGGCYGYRGGYRYYRGGGCNDGFWWGLGLGVTVPLALSYTWANPPVYRYETVREIDRRPPPAPPQPSAVVYNAQPPPPSPEDLMLARARQSRPAPAADAAAPSAPGSPPRSATLGVADVKRLAANGIGDGVIISQIQHSGATFSLGTQEIIDLKEAGVSESVIEAMIDTAPAPTPAKR